MIFDYLVLKKSYMIKLAINNLSINLFSFSQWSTSFRDIDHYPLDARFSPVTIENLNLKGVIFTIEVDK